MMPKLLQIYLKSKYYNVLEYYLIGNIVRFVEKLMESTFIQANTMDYYVRSINI